MRQKIFLPKWYLDGKPKDLVLSDDIDSLVSCAILHKIHPNWRIKYFYNFDGLYKVDTTYSNKRVWVDVAVQNDEMAFDNHVSLATHKTHKNENMINPNYMLDDITNHSNYTEKYAGSTAMMLWSLYDMPIPKTDEGKAILWNIDVGYKGMLKKEFFMTNYFYFYCILELFDMCNWLMEHRLYDFNKNRVKYGLQSKITIDDDGMLHTDLDLENIGELLGLKLELPSMKFHKIESFSNKVKDFNEEQLNRIIDFKKSGVLTAAFTRKNKMNFSRRED